MVKRVGNCLLTDAGVKIWCSPEPAVIIQKQTPFIPPKKPPNPPSPPVKPSNPPPQKKEASEENEFSVQKIVQKTLEGVRDPIPEATTKFIPQKARYSADVIDEFYEYIKQIKADDLPFFDSDAPEILNDFISDNVADSTKRFFGDVDVSLSNAYGLVTHNADTKSTNVFFRGASFDELPTVVPSVLQRDGALRKIIEDNHFKMVKQAISKYGSVDTVFGHSMGGQAAHLTVQNGLAKEAITLNPWATTDIMTNGSHTVVSQPRDFFNRTLTRAARLSHNNPNYRNIILPDVSKRGFTQLDDMMAAHSVHNFVDDAIPVESFDSLGISYDNPRVSIRKRAPISLRTIKGVGLNVVGSLVTDVALSKAGVKNEYIKDAASGLGGGLLEAGALATTLGAGVSSAGVGLVGGSGVAAGAWLANKTGVKGGGKTALEVTGGLINTGLGTLVATNWWNPVGIIAGAVLASEAAAIGIAEAVG